MTTPIPGSAVLALSFLVGPALAETSRNRGGQRLTIRWPDPRFPTLQAAIDAAPAGATVRIARGEYRLTELSGFDAGIATTDERGPAHVSVVNVQISETGRGLVARAAGAVRVERSLVHHTLWNGMSIAPPPGQFSFFLGLNNYVQDLLGIGAFFVNTNAFLVAQVVENAACGGLVGVNTTGAAITTSTIRNNGRVGILLNEPQGYSAITGTEVLNTYENSCLPGGAGGGGQGIAIVSSQTPASPVWVVDNSIRGNASYGLGNHGSHVALGDYEFSCNAPDLVGSNYVAGQFVFLNLEEPVNIGCGCPNPTGPCIAQPTSLEPPGAQGP